MEEERLKRRTIQRTDRAWRQREATKEARRDEMKNEHEGKRSGSILSGMKARERERERGETRRRTSEKKNRSWWVHLKPKIHSCCRAELSRGFGSSEQELIEGAKFIS